MMYIKFSCISMLLDIVSVSTISILEELANHNQAFKLIPLYNDNLPAFCNLHIATSNRYRPDIGQS